MSAHPSHKRLCNFARKHCNWIRRLSFIPHDSCSHCSHWPLPPPVFDALLLVLPVARLKNNVKQQYTILHIITKDVGKYFRSALEDLAQQPPWCKSNNEFPQQLLLDLLLGFPAFVFKPFLQCKRSFCDLAVHVKEYHSSSLKLTVFRSKLESRAETPSFQTLNTSWVVLSDKCTATSSALRSSMAWLCSTVNWYPVICGFHECGSRW